MYFDHCQNLNQLKSAYKKLAMKHHPDMGGDEATMKAVNAEHDRVFEVLRDMQNEEADRPGSDVRRTTETPEEFRTVVDVLLGIEGVEVELCGAWLWIGGDTYESREILKSVGCMWSRSKRKWYWRHAEDDCKWSRGKTSMKQIRAKYGSERIGRESEPNLLSA